MDEETESQRGRVTWWARGRHWMGARQSGCSCRHPDHREAWKQGRHLCVPVSPQESGASLTVGPGSEPRGLRVAHRRSGPGLPPTGALSLPLRGRKCLQLQSSTQLVLTAGHPWPPSFLCFGATKPHGHRLRLCCGWRGGTGLGDASPRPTSGSQLRLQPPAPTPINSRVFQGPPCLCPRAQVLSLCP